MKRFVIVTIVLAACGGSEKPATTDPTTKPAMDEHDKLTPELTAFHNVLKPLWHQDKGDAQVTATCGATADLLTKAKAVQAAPVPDKVDAAAWADAGTKLVASVEALGATCTGDKSTFDATFNDVHNAFHAAMGLEMGESHEHMEGMEHGEHDGMEGMEHH